MSLIRHGQFWYIGTPYSKYPLGLEVAFQMASEVTARLAMRDIPVYSPIAHGHPVAAFCSVDPTDHEFWVKFDAPMVNAAAGLIVVMAEGWELSRGLQHEIMQFLRAGKPVVYWDPTTQIPVETLKPVVIRQ